MKVYIKRYKEGNYITSEYSIDIRKNWTILDLLNYIKENFDETLTYRVMCRSSVCGTCAVKVNDKPILACKEKADSFGDHITIEPISNFRPIKDLVVDHSAVEGNLRKGNVWYKRENYKGSVCKVNFRKVERQWDCISCLICESVCPVFSEKFGGPYAFTRIYRIVEDPKYDTDMGFGDVLRKLHISECVHCGYCSIYCPKGCMPEFAIKSLEIKFNIRKESDNLDFLSF